MSDDESTGSCDVEGDVVVVGGGLSGLTAAHRILSTDGALRVFVLEAKDRIGGRTWSIPLTTHTGEQVKFDFGGHWIGPSHKHVLGLVDELGLQTYSQFHRGKTIWHTATTKEIFQGDVPYVNSILSNYELQRFLGRVDALSDGVRQGDPLSSADAAALDAQTLESFMADSLSSTGARETFRTLVRMHLGVETTEISALSFFFYANGAGGFQNWIRPGSEGVKALKIKGGAQQLCQKITRRIGKRYVHARAVVRAVEQFPNRVHVTTDNGVRYKCEYVVMAVPPHEILKVRFVPPLPAQTRKALERFPTAHLATFVATYDQLFWRRHGFSGHAVMNTEPRAWLGGRASPVAATYDATSAAGHPALMGYMAGVHGVLWSAEQEAVRREGVLKTLASLWGEEALTPLDYREVDWSQEEFVGGCPFSPFTPGIGAAFYQLRLPFKRVLWAGTETSTLGAGFLEGAVQAATRAAVEVLYELRPQAIGWKDLAGVEDEY